MIPHEQSELRDAPNPAPGDDWFPSIRVKGVQSKRRRLPNGMRKSGYRLPRESRTIKAIWRFRRFLPEACDYLS